MAINLTVALNDSEQAKLAEVAALVAPGASPAQVKAWAEKTAKEALRQVVIERARDARRESENEARRTAEAADAAAWPEPVEATPPEG